jgi:hypothetical protein
MRYDSVVLGHGMSVFRLFAQFVKKSSTTFYDGSVRLLDTCAQGRLQVLRAMTLLLMSACVMMPKAAATAATYYVSVNGSDSNPGTQALPWRTIQKGANTAVAGDVVNVAPGKYGELVTTAAHGNSTAPVTFRATPANDPLNQVITRQFRVKHRYVVIEGFNITGASDMNNASIRIEAPNGTTDGSDCVVTNCTIRDGVWLKSSDVTFSGNSVSVHDAANFNTAGFVPGSLIFFGADSLHAYTNHDTSHQVLSVSTDGKTLTVSDTLAADATGHYWGVFYAGSDNSAFKGIALVMGSGSAATNCAIVSNTFSNLFGPVLLLNGSGHTIANNHLVANNGWYAIQAQSSSTMIRDNLFLNNRNVEFWTPAELNGIQHPSGGNYFDYQENVIGSWVANVTNVWLLHNWFQDCDNQLTQIEAVSGSVDFHIVSNVFVGMLQHGSLSRDSLILDHNTFYKNAYMMGESLSAGIGGSHGTLQTGLVITSNVWVDVGDHAAPGNESAFTLTDTTNYSLGGNFCAQAQTMGFSRMGVNPGGFLVQGGDPVFANAADPLGPDGLPFTADDGLKPLPNSPLVRYGLGAEPPRLANAPSAYFRETSVTTWQDATGTNYDPVWVSQRPNERPTAMRHWATPEALGKIPVTVNFDASQSIDGLETNWFTILYFSWDFGDGAKVVTHMPAASHTYTTTGTNWVTLWVTNLYGATAVYSNVFRTLPASGTTIAYVSLGGNDSTGDGSVGNPWRTIQKAASSAAAGWTISVGPGAYNELVNCTAVAAQNNRIRFVGHGSSAYGFNLRNSDYTVEGFDCNGVGVPTFGGIMYVYATANRVHLYNNIMHNVTNIYGVMLNTAGQLPANGPANCVISNNVFYKIHNPNLLIQGNGTMAIANIIRDSESEGDAFRLWGANHYIGYNLCTNLSAYGGGGHADFIQSFGDLGGLLTNVLIEGNMVLGNDVQICMFEHDSTGNQNFSNPYTNIVFRNNLFANVQYAANVDIDGTKWYNNLFYKVNTGNGGHVFAFGGVKGSAYGTEIKNNAFVACGNGTTIGWYPILGDSGVSNWSLAADYNFVCNATFGAFRIAPPDGSGNFQSNGEDPHGINGGDPKFVSAASNDFRILNGSALVGHGTQINSETTDLVGSSRGSAWDIGPYQHSQPTPGILPPSHLRVVGSF